MNAPLDEDENSQELAASSEELIQMQFKDHFTFALSTSLTTCLQQASGFFLPVYKKNNTIIVLFRQNAFDLLVALKRVLAEGLKLLSSHGKSSSRVNRSASGAADVTGFQEEFKCCWNLLKQVCSF